MASICGGRVLHLSKPVDIVNYSAPRVCMYVLIRGAVSLPRVQGTSKMGINPVVRVVQTVLSKIIKD